MNSKIPSGTAYIDASKADQLIRKWTPVLDYTSKTVGPIEDEHTRLNTSIILENQEKWCLREANVAGGAGNMFGYGGAGGGFGTNGGSV
jgi:hypothetical protein